MLMGFLLYVIHTKEVMVSIKNIYFYRVSFIT